MRLGRIEHTDDKAGSVQRHGQRDPVAAGRFEHDQRGGGRSPGGLELLLKSGEASRTLVEGARHGQPPAGCCPRRGEGGGGDVDADEELVGWGGSWCSHALTRLQNG